MAEVTSTQVKVNVDLKVVLELNEQEVGALEAMFSYGPDAFLKGFYKQCGKAYVEPYEAGVRSLHEKMRGLMSSPLREVQQMRDRINAALSKKSR
jgi:hypothetical protein